MRAIYLNKRSIHTPALLPFTGGDVTRACTFYTVLIIREQRQIDVSLPPLACSPVGERWERRKKMSVITLCSISYLLSIARGSVSFRETRYRERHLRIRNAERKFSLPINIFVAFWGCFKSSKYVWMHKMGLRKWEQNEAVFYMEYY